MSPIARITGRMCAIPITSGMIAVVRHGNMIYVSEDFGTRFIPALVTEMTALALLPTRTRLIEPKALGWSAISMGPHHYAMVVWEWLRDEVECDRTYQSGPSSGHNWSRTAQIN